MNYKNVKRKPFSKLPEENDPWFQPAGFNRGKIKSMSIECPDCRGWGKIFVKAGIPNERLILDPGIGFGKLPEVDFAILRELNQFKLLGRPLLVGVSRKAFIGSCLDEPNPKDRLGGTIAATSIAVANGADIIRAHDVVEAKIASKIGEAVRFYNDKVIQ